jgi:hypothetical protein
MALEKFAFERMESDPRLTDAARLLAFINKDIKSIIKV